MTNEEREESLKLLAQLAARLGMSIVPSDTVPPGSDSGAESKLREAASSRGNRSAPEPNLTPEQAEKKRRLEEAREIAAVRKEVNKEVEAKLKARTEEDGAWLLPMKVSRFDERRARERARAQQAKEAQAKAAARGGR